MTRKLPDIVTNSGLIWLPEIEIGFHPEKPMTYQGDYWDEYQRRDKTDIGKQLTNARVAFVRKHFSGSVLDIGIGGGAFAKAVDGFGYDVNQQAIEWLKRIGRYRDPYKFPVKAITCWDSLEHIEEPEKLLKQVTDYVFMSIPIFDGPAHCLKSKHFKPGEHIYYFTNNGLIAWMEKQGFECIDNNQIESDLGREGIETYSFIRK